jgi:hypothetical protein
VDNGDEQHGDEEPEATAGEIGSRCSLCRTAITAEFFSLRGLVLCPSCADGVRRRQSGGGNLRRALRFGFLAAAPTAIVWFLASAASGRPLSLVAVVAGVVIGLAVHQGSGGRGGLRYQIIAILLVYAAFVARFVPPVFGGIADAIKREHAAAQAPAPKPAPPAPAATPHGTVPPAVPAAAPSPSAPSPSAAEPSTFATLKAYFIFAAIAWGLVLASPFLPSTTSWLSLLSLAAGIALAFRLNRRPRLLGPFRS